MTAIGNLDVATGTCAATIGSTGDQATRATGVTAATARVAFGLLDDNVAEDCGDTCTPTSSAQTS